MKKGATKGGKRPDVRRIWFADAYTADTTGDTVEIFTAEQNCTLVGVDLNIVVAGSPAASGNLALMEWGMQAGVSSTMSWAEATNIDEAKNIFIHKHDIICKGASYQYEINKKYKRTLVKGEKIYLKHDASSTDAALYAIISGYLYIME